MQKIHFNSEGLQLAGHLFLPTDFEENQSYPAIVVSGSWTTVKEQMAGLYARRFAEKGFITLAFDFRNFGESEGQPAAYESPRLKIEDIQNAVRYLATLPQVDAQRIGAFGVCAGSMYTLMAAAAMPQIKAVVTAASWLHDAEAVQLFYGGAEGVQDKISQAQAAKKKYAETGEATYIKTISTTDTTAAMYGEYDYYLNPERGAVPQWSADRFAVASWEDWLTLDPFPAAAQFQQPILMIHSDGCVLPDYTRKFFQNIASTDKHLQWIDTELGTPMHQFAFYDQDKEVSQAVTEGSRFFREKL